MTTPTTRARTRTRQRSTGAQSTDVTHRKDGQETALKEDAKAVVVEGVHPTPAYVRVTGGATHNMGNYESVRVSVSVEMPCDPNEDAVRNTYQQLSQWVDSMIQQETDLALGEQDHDAQAL